MTNHTNMQRAPLRNKKKSNLLLEIKREIHSNLFIYMTHYFFSLHVEFTKTCNCNIHIYVFICVIFCLTDKYILNFYVSYDIGAILLTENGTGKW